MDLEDQGEAGRDDSKGVEDSLDSPSVSTRDDKSNLSMRRFGEGLQIATREGKRYSLDLGSKTARLWKSSGSGKQGQREESKSDDERKN
jgi:hypothetical protein